MSTIQFCRIDNQIIEKLPGGFMICPITRYEKIHGIKLDLSRVPYVSLGSRGKDNMYLLKLMDSDTSRFEDLPIIIPV
jgi:hypothetical protein